MIHDDVYSSKSIIVRLFFTLVDIAGMLASARTNYHRIRIEFKSNRIDNAIASHIITVNNSQGMAITNGSHKFKVKTHKYKW